MCALAVVFWLSWEDFNFGIEGLYYGPSRDRLLSEARVVEVERGYSRVRSDVTRRIIHSPGCPCMLNVLQVDAVRLMGSGWRRWKLIDGGFAAPAVPSSHTWSGTCGAFSPVARSCPREGGSLTGERWKILLNDAGEREVIKDGGLELPACMAEARTMVRLRSVTARVMQSDEAEPALRADLAINAGAAYGASCAISQREHLKTPTAQVKMVLMRAVSWFVKTICERS